MMKYFIDDLTLVVMAYKESPFLEEAVKSVVSQTIPVKVVISTSTPNKHISDIGIKYNLPIFINKGVGDACDNFNFAYSMANTKLVTLIHQDDIYMKEFAEETLKYLNSAKAPIICFTAGAELREDVICSSGMILKIKKIMLLPLKSKTLRNRKWIKRLILAFGDPICCPTVTFVKEKIIYPVFTPGYIANIDWQAWERLSRVQGSFVYINRELLVHRIHKDSATSTTIAAKIRRQEDLEMFKVFWPHWFANILIFLYQISEKSNK